jgi:hypothetical protein
MQFLSVFLECQRYPCLSQAKAAPTFVSPSPEAPMERWCDGWVLLPLVPLLCYLPTDLRRRIAAQISSRVCGPWSPLASPRMHMPPEPARADGLHGGNHVHASDLDACRVHAMPKIWCYLVPYYNIVRWCVFSVLWIRNRWKPIYVKTEIGEHVSLFECYSQL